MKSCELFTAKINLMQCFQLLEVCTCILSTGFCPLPDKMFFLLGTSINSHSSKIEFDFNSLLLLVKIVLSDFQSENVICRAKFFLYACTCTVQDSNEREHITNS